MATTFLQFTSPAPGTTVGETITVSGADGVTGQIGKGNIIHSPITVQFGAGGQPIKATPSPTGTWTCTGSVSASATSGGPITISAVGNVTYPLPGSGEPQFQTDPASGTLTVTFVSPPPTLTDVTLQPPYLEVSATTLPYAVIVSGTATPSTALSHISAVQYSLDGSAFANVDNPSGNWSTWSKKLALPAGTHNLVVQATDTHSNTTVYPAFTIDVRIPIPQTDADKAFAPTTYLRDLLDLALRQVKTPANSAGCTATLLATSYYQPFDRLTLATLYQQAVQPIHQARVAIEILRQIISTKPGVPPDLDQQYRLLAYKAILRGVGTSFDELRLARVAAPATRQALAARIGIEIGTARPDSLDQMLLLSTDLTDAALETLFGYRSTAPADPLATHVEGGSTFSSWQTSGLRNIWQRGDAQTRDSAAGALPIVDPDVISSGNTKVQTTAFSLWTARTTWINTTLSKITTEANTVIVPLTRFDQLVSHYIGNVDIASLAANDANGSDISAPLAPLYLDLDALRFLALCRQLLSTAAGTSPAFLLPSEWDDIFAILLETQKRQQYRQWRLEETQGGVVLAPDQFQPDSATPAPPILAWRGSSDTFSQWRRTLIGRAAQLQTVVNSYLGVVDAAEAQTLPTLRDALLQIIAKEVTQSLDYVSEDLSRNLVFDFRLNAGPKTTRAELAIETLQGILSSVRSGQLANAGSTWTLDPASTFDAEWVWLSTFQTWFAANRVFAYPENQLSPNLYVADNRFLTPHPLTPTSSFQTLIASLRNAAKMTPESARLAAGTYLTSILLAEAAGHLPANFSLTERLSDAGLLQLQQLIASSSGTDLNPSDYPQYLREIFYLVPMAIALRLQSDREYVAALDWFRTVYAFNLPAANRKIFVGLTLEASITTAYTRLPNWIATELNPHLIVRVTTSGTTLVGRKNAYMRFTVLSIVQCLLAYADQQFSSGSAELTAQARTLYETAANLLNLPELQPEAKAPGAPDPPYLPNPVWQSLLLQAQSSLAKIHNGLNIAGILAAPSTGDSTTVFLPSQYRYQVLVDRAKNLVAIAQQVEVSFLAALEKRDAENYSQLQANNDIEVAASSITLADLKVADAGISVTEAQLQKDKADVQFNEYNNRINNGLNFYEDATLGALGTAAAFRTANAFNPEDFLFFEGASNIAEAASAIAQLTQAKASYERTEEDWTLQRNLADVDRQIGDQQILNAQTQQSIAQQERQLAGLQLEHATAVLDFLANKFTNAELFDWMSGVLGRVYAYFLQQATAIAQLAEAQLAFERQAPPSGFVRSDYWQDTSDSTDPGVDRQGLTGSERLLQDINQLDEYAFETDRRKLHITQTVIVSQIAALELQTFRETGLLVFATPMNLFDQDFPGHYLRLIKSVQISLIALVPAVLGVRATLSASGLSRVVVPGDEFQSVTLSRSPEAFSFTSPLNATGLFDLEPDTGILLPFEGMGVDAVWQLELPKAANPFDFRTIVDVQLTIKYTALNSYDYREQVIRNLDRSFSGDRSFSLRDEFPDAWYLLNNPETVADPASQMRATLSIDREDFQPNIEDLSVQQVSLYCLRNDGVTQELNVLSLALTAAGVTTTSTATVSTLNGVAGTRRPSGAPWQVLVGQDPAGDWSLQLEDTDAVRDLFKDGSIQDIALVLTVGGVTPMWP